MADPESLQIPSPDEGDQLQDEKERGENEDAVSKLDDQSARNVIRAALLILDAVAATIFLASFAGFADGPDQWTLTLVSCLGVSLWGVFLLISCFVLWKKQREGLNSFLGWTRNLSIYFGLIASLLTGILLFLGALTSCGPNWQWLGAFYHVAGFLQAMLCLLVWCLLPRMVRPHVGGSLTSSRHTRPVRRWVALLLVFGTLVGPLITFWVVAWWYTGYPELDESVFPDFATSPYKLPFPKGETTFVSQGNFGKFSHSYDYSYDFMLPCGSPILAARAGYVESVVDRHDGNVWTKEDDYYNNYIRIRHVDEEDTIYHHLEQGSAMVKTGDFVNQGDHIALVGNVGYSTGPHIHFAVERDWSSVPASFQDAPAKVSGIPRALNFYKSGNDGQ